MKYFNSSIQGINEGQNYILTQSPLKETVTDLWRLVNDYNSTIVMLNQIPMHEVHTILDALNSIMLISVSQHRNFLTVTDINPKLKDLKYNISLNIIITKIIVMSCHFLFLFSKTFLTAATKMFSCGVLAIRNRIIHGIWINDHFE